MVMEGKESNQEERKPVLRRSFFMMAAFSQFLFFSNETNKSIIIYSDPFHFYPQECYPHSNLLPSEVVV